MKKIAVVLSGCGYKDGAEITESVSTLIALSEQGVEYKVFAPRVAVAATDHLSEGQSEKRDALTEAARIARGHIQDLGQLSPGDFDALVFPGGFGAAKVLCTFAQQGAQCEVLPQIKEIIEGFYREEKPIAAICIAPALIARVLGSHGITVTIGSDASTAAEIKKTGAHHENCAVEDYVTDREHRLVTTPAYMYDEAKPHQVFKGIRGALKELVEMA